MVKMEKYEIALMVSTPILGILVMILLYQPPGTKVFEALPRVYLPYAPQTLRAVAIGLIVMLSGPAFGYYSYMRRIESIINNTPLMLQDIAVAVRSGTKVYASFVEISDRDYGALTPYVRRIASLIYLLGLDMLDALKLVITELPRETRKYFYFIEEAYESGGRAIEVLDKASELARRIREFEEEREKTLKTQGFIIIFSVLIFVATAAILYYLSVQMYASSVEVNKKLGKEQLQPIDPLEVLGYIFYMSISLSIFAGIATGKIVKGTTAAGLFYATMVLMLSLAIVLLLPYVIPPYPKHVNVQGTNPLAKTGA
ncbi:hypothetical protein IPA_00315 [Ignicoccus pacificus DSM 13166]|uniref:Type II secretion system protein GspF domain-containing protein n=1 Tax=Ignicoccus pacificus DSM 13166 TaxID=940294 RepID=A0A977KAA8_9CREN|nr:hypothetical protein IPA_00315 [Ignicoccus pacificus DSM 13166]